MPCYHPLRAFQFGDAQPVFKVPQKAGFKFLTLPCGQCIGCRLEHSRQWAVRCMHEAQMHKSSLFLTLTYDDSSLQSWSLVPRDLQLFMKRLRKFSVEPIRFYACGEYGEISSRPHFHVLAFGLDLEDKEYLRTTRGGHRLYTSAALDRLWGKGQCWIGAVSFESAAYCARYVLKKLNDDSLYVEILDPETGEWFSRRKEFSRMSRRPGLGATWLKRFWADVFPEGEVVSRGRLAHSPRAYDKVFELEDAVGFEAMKARRRFAADLNFDEGSTSRLKVRELVASAKSKSLKRS